MTSEYKRELLILEAKLEKDPNNQQYLELQRELKSIIELSEELEVDREASIPKDQIPSKTHDPKNETDTPTPSTSNDTNSTATTSSNTDVDKKAAERKESKIRNNKKKKSKAREKMKEKLALAEQEKQTWQSFASKGLKGMTKKSIFASPISVAGKVGVGTNGIADAPAASSYARNRKFT